MSALARVRALIAWFENEAFEDLYGVCCTQIAQLYSLDPVVLHETIVETIQTLLVSKKTYKRQIGAGLFEKIVNEFQMHVDQNEFVFEKSLLNFDAKSFVENLEKNKKEKQKSELNFETFVNENFLKNSQEHVKNFLVRKENYLYSKSEKAISEKEKSIWGLSKNVEEDILKKINEELMREQEPTFGKKWKVDQESCQIEIKWIKDNTSAIQQQTQNKSFNNPTSIFDIIYQLSWYLVFHSNWEFWHGALLIFRVIARKYNYIKFWELDNKNSECFNSELITNFSINFKNVKDTDYYNAYNVNEDIKQKCIILLALDRFSDFIADKSNMTNRALSADILAILFTNVSNLEQFFYIFELLFLQNVKNGWEPKQAFIYLAMRLHEQKEQSKVQIINEQSLFWISTFILEIVSEHEEISEAAACFVLSLLKSNYEYEKYKNIFENYQIKFVQILLTIDDISYLPKSVFELLSEFLKWGILHKEVLENLKIILQKFLLHENEEVWNEIFNFIQTFVQYFKTQQIFCKEPEIIYQYLYFCTLLFQLISKNQEPNTINFENNLTILESDKTINILVNILSKFNNWIERFSLLCFLFKLLEERDLSIIVEKLNLGFSYQLQKAIPVNIIYILSLITQLLQKIELNDINDLFDHLSIESKFNSLIFVPFLLQDNFTLIQNEQVQNFLERAETLVKVNFLTNDATNIKQDLEMYFVKNTSDIDLEKIPELEGLIVNILLLLSKELWDVCEYIILQQNLVNLLTKLKNCIQTGLISYNKIKMCFELEGQILPKCNELVWYSTLFALMLKCSAANFILNQCLWDQVLPQRSIINQLVKPLLETFSEEISTYFINQFAITLFKLELIYKAESKHPNSKIVQSLLKKAEHNKILWINIYPYVNMIFQKYQEHSDQRFPELLEIFKNPSLLAQYIKILISVKNQSQFVYGNQIMKLFEQGQLGTSDEQCIICGTVFQNILQSGVAFGGYLMNIFLEILFNKIKQWDNLAFLLLIYLFSQFKQDFVIFSKIFLKEIIKAVNDSSIDNRKQIFETFSMIIGISYIDTEIIWINTLHQNLIDSYYSGKQFLYEFQSSKNFNIEFQNIYQKQNTNFSIRSYQQEGISWLHFLFKNGLSACLCDDMGLGKTLQALSAIALCHSNILKSTEGEICDVSQVQHISLVICPSNVITHWKKECDEFIKPAALRVQYILPGMLSSYTPLSSFVQCTQDSILFVVSYNLFCKIIDYIDIKFKVLVLDEAHLIKNPKSIIAQKVKQIKSELRFAITGTPIQNSIIELWSIFDFLMPLYLGQKDLFWKEFKSLLDMNLLSIDLQKMQLSSQQQDLLDNLHQKVLPFIMRWEKKEVLKELPDKIIQDILCEMTPNQKEIYKLLENQEVINSGSFDNNNTILNNQNVIKKQNFFFYLSLIRRVLNHPILITKITNLIKNQQTNATNQPLLSSEIQEENELDDYQTKLLKIKSILDLMSNKKNCDFYSNSGKFVALKELLNNLNFLEEDTLSCIANENKLLIFTWSTETLDLLFTFLKDSFPLIKILQLQNSQTIFQRSDIVEKFNKNLEYKILLLTPKIGGLGLNLTSANVVIMFDHDFNPMNDLQAMDWAHWLGQKKTVNVFRFITQETLEEKIMGIQRFKLSISNTVVNVENASINNVKDSDFVSQLEKFATTQCKSSEEQTVEGSLDKYAKYIKDSHLADIWEADEYDREFLQLNNFN